MLHELLCSPTISPGKKRISPIGGGGKKVGLREEGKGKGKR